MAQNHIVKSGNNSDERVAGLRKLGREDRVLESALSEAKLGYGDLQKLFETDSARNTVDIKSTKLYEMLESLTGTIIPLRELKFDTSWGYLYLPLIADSPTAIPLSIAKYANDYRNEYFVRFNDEYLGTVRILKGDEKYDDKINTVFDEARRILPRLESVEQIERYVPPEYRTGRVKMKYFSDGEKFLTAAAAKRIMKEYKAHLARNLKSEPVSLNQYLKVASICYAGVFGDSGDPVKLYEKHSDFRHAGILEISDYDSVEQFSKFIKEYDKGCHPFEIITGAKNAIILYPPTQQSPTFVLNSGSNIYANYLVKGLRALMESNVAVTTYGLSEALKYLTGDAYYNVNRRYDGIDILELDEEGRKELSKHVIWDGLTLARMK